MADVETSGSADEREREDLAEIAKTLRRLHLGLLGFGVYFVVTLVVEDAVLVRADAEIDIPVFGLAVELGHILVFAPICLVALTLYLHLFYGAFLSYRRRGVEVSQAFLFTMPGTAPRIVTVLILYAFLPLVLAWSSWKALFRPEAPLLVALTVITSLVLALLHQRRADEQTRRRARAATALTAGLALALVLWVAVAGWDSVRALRSVDLVGANLSKSDLRKVDLRNFDLTRANLDDADLFGADLRGADLSDATLRNAKLIDVNLDDATLVGATLDGARFDDGVAPVEDDATILTSTCTAGSSASLARSDLRGARLTSTVLRGVDLRDADLSGADLRQADLTCADLRGAKLERARLIRVSAGRLRAHGAVLEEANLAKADLRGALLIGVILRKADLDQAVLGQTSFAAADLRQASLRELDILDEVNFTHARLAGTNPDATTLCADAKLVTCVGIKR